jgi:hypothetical protein
MNRNGFAMLATDRTWPTTDFQVTTSGASETFSLNLYSPVGLVIDWGDGSDNTYNATGLASHVYAVAGSYTVKMRGQCQRFAFFGGTPTKVTALLSPIQGISGITSAEAMFRGCTAITSVPTDFFRYCPNILSLAQVFYDCANLASVDADIFRYNTLATTAQSAFRYCVDLASIPTDLFRYNTALTVMSYIFEGCTSLTSAPADTFRYNTLATTFAFCFSGCTGLTAIPAGIFDYNVLATTFINTFYGCNQITLNPYIFFASGEESTRFLNKSVDFTNCFYRADTFTGTQGTAPALWDCDFGTRTPTTTDCFRGHDATTVDNYASIPAGWL